MKLPRLRTVAVAGTLVGATIVLAAPQASAMPIESFAADCNGMHGQLGQGWHFEFNADGDVVSNTLVATCRVGSVVMWNDTDIFGDPYDN
jgi:hypothetical protein